MIDIKEIDNMTMEQLVNYIQTNYHKPLIEDLNNVDNPIHVLELKYKNEDPEVTYLVELYSQFRKEIFRHLTKEDNETFPAVIEFEKHHDNEEVHLADNVDEIERLVDDTEMKNDHSTFDSYLESIMEVLHNSKLNERSISEFEDTKEIFIKINNDMVEHSKLENDNLYCKGVEMQQKLRAKLGLLEKYGE